MNRLDYVSDYVRGVAVYWLPTWLLTGASWAATAWSHTPLDIIIACVLVVVDFSLGTWYALRQRVFCWKRVREGIDKAGFKALILGGSLTFVGTGNPVLDGFGKFLVAGVVILELRSVIRNMDALTSEKFTFFRALLAHIDRFDFRGGLKALTATVKPVTPLEATPDSDDASVIHLHGELDHSNSEALREQMKGTLDRHGRVTLDARGLTFIDSTGLVALISAVKHALGAGLARDVVVLRDPDRRCLKILTLTGLDQVVAIQQTADEQP